MTAKFPVEVRRTVALIFIITLFSFAPPENMIKAGLYVCSMFAVSYDSWCSGIEAERSKDMKINNSL